MLLPRSATSMLPRLAGITRSLSQTAMLSTATAQTSKPLLLYTAGTPNGRKVSILLEELKVVYGIDYE